MIETVGGVGACEPGSTFKWGGGLKKSRAIDYAHYLGEAVNRIQEEPISKSPQSQRSDGDVNIWEAYLSSMNSVYLSSRGGAETT